MQQGEYEGAGAPSCWIECLQKARKRGRLPKSLAEFHVRKREVFSTKWQSHFVEFNYVCF